MAILLQVHESWDENGHSVSVSVSRVCLEAIQNQRPLWAHVAREKLQTFVAYVTFFNNHRYLNQLVLDIVP